MSDLIMQSYQSGPIQPDPDPDEIRIQAMCDQLDELTGIALEKATRVIAAELRADDLAARMLAAYESLTFAESCKMMDSE
jgi:hypothetical protein